MSLNKIIFEALQASGVKIRIYFSGVMDGNHCMRFSEFGEKIMEKITKDMLELDGIKGNENLTVAVNKHHCHMKKILSLWFKIQRIMNTIGRLPKQTIADF